MSSFIFGVLHLFNLFQSDSIIITVLAQVIYATMFGIGFGIILLGTGSIYPIGFIHGIINFFSSWDKLPGVIEPANAADFKTLEAVVSVGIVIPFLLYMLRQLKLIDRKVI
jgi:membrane protease YdiL (CAAX protease family)